MKTRYKYIHFEKDDPTLDRWFCCNNKTNSEMAEIIYYEPWKQYVIEYMSEFVFNNSCLRDIADFLDQLNSQLKDGKISSDGKKKKT